MSLVRVGASLAVLCTAAACSHIAPSVEVREPAPGPRVPQFALAKPANGAIWTDDVRALFEDRRARRIGDVLTINIAENLSATQRSGSSIDRSGSTSIGVPTLQKFPIRALQGAAVEASSDTQFDGKGETSNNNVFTGSITVTVVEVLPNGHLVVSGDKQIGINRDVQSVRVSGVVDPASILQGNVVSSTKVADARFDWRGRGQINEAQTMGWLSRFFMTVSPF